MSYDNLDSRTRWIAFSLLCLGDLMIVLDSTIVNVALPTIRESLGFSESALVWVVNAYLLTFGGFMLLGGRLADLYGRRKVFLYGVAGFTLASIACGLAQGQTMLIVARAIQGVAGAVVSAVTLSLIMDLFPEGPGRVRAMGYFGFIMAGGGSIGMLLGGVLTGAFDWRSIFLVNVPVGAVVIALTLKLMPYRPGVGAGVKLDIWGAATITLALLLAVYAIVGGEANGWTSAVTLGLLGAAVVLFGLFLVIETKVPSPVVPLRLFKLRNVSTANVVGVLWAAAMFAWFFLSALYLQQVLSFDPMAVGLAFLPANLIMGAFSYSLSAKIVNRFGIRWPLAVGLWIATIGLILFAFAPVDGGYWLHVFPAMSLLGIGGGMAFNPLLLAAMNDVDPAESGLASGVVNTSFMMGGSLGLAILVAIAASGNATATAAGLEAKAALNAGYHTAFLVGAAFAFLAGSLAAALIRAKPMDPATMGAH